MLQRFCAEFRRLQRHSAHTGTEGGAANRADSDSSTAEGRGDSDDSDILAREIEDYVAARVRAKGGKGSMPLPIEVVEGLRTQLACNRGVNIS